MPKPDWQKAHQKVFEICYEHERKMGWSHELALVRAKDRATKSSERSINAYNEDVKMVSGANPSWSQEQIDREVERLQRMKYMHDTDPRRQGNIKHIRWLVDGEEVLKVD